MKSRRRAQESDNDQGLQHIVSKSAPRGLSALWGSISRYMGDSNVCDAERKQLIERQLIRMIIRMGLPLGFAENHHFQDLIALLCPAYVKTCDPFPGIRLYMNSYLLYVCMAMSLCISLCMFICAYAYACVYAYAYACHFYMRRSAICESMRACHYVVGRKKVSTTGLDYEYELVKQTTEAYLDNEPFTSTSVDGWENQSMDSVKMVNNIDSK